MKFLVPIMRTIFSLLWPHLGDHLHCAQDPLFTELSHLSSKNVRGEYAVNG
jgi:hypothetical protein